MDDFINSSINLESIYSLVTRSSYTPVMMITIKRSCCILTSGRWAVSFAKIFSVFDKTVYIKVARMQRLFRFDYTNGYTDEKTAEKQMKKHLSEKTYGYIIAYNKINNTRGNMLIGRRKQNWVAFMILACLFGTAMVVLGVVTIVQCIREENTGFILPMVVIVLLGAGLFVGSIWAWKTFGNANIGKKDNSIIVTYQMAMGSAVHSLTDMNRLKDVLADIRSDQEVLITLTPEYFGLMSWKFIKVKDYYISFVDIRKKDRVLSYFVMPNQDLDAALQPFADVFQKHMAVNTSKLIDKKRYEAVMDFYKLS